MEVRIAKQKNIGEAALDLLSEVNDICESNNINYFLSPGMTRRAVGHFDFNEYFTMPVIYMTLDNSLKFIDVIERSMPEGRSLDYLGSNNRYATFNISYVNTETTFIDLSRGQDFSQYGIKVIINIIRNDINDRIPAFIETGRESNSFKAKKKGSWKKRVFEFFVARGMHVKGEDFSKSLLDYYIRSYSKNSDSPRVFIRGFRKKRLYFDRDIFSESCLVSLNEKQYHAPKRIEDYLTTYYGENYAANDLKPYNKGKSIISSVVPFREYLAGIEAIGLPIDMVFEQQKEIRTDIIINKKLLKAVNNTYCIARMSEERMLLYKDLHEKEDDIRFLRQQHDYEELEKIFEEYNARAKAYIKNGLALCPSEELFDIECELMEHKGYFKRAKKMRNLVAEHHKEPLIGKASTEES